MRLIPALSALCLAAVSATPVLAQRIVYYSVPAPEGQAPFHALTPREFAKALSVGVPTRNTASAARGPTIDSVIVVQRTCPMPVVRPDSARLESMPVAVIDSTSPRTMPVAKPNCRNTLQR